MTYIGIVIDESVVPYKWNEGSTLTPKEVTDLNAGTILQWFLQRVKNLSSWPDQKISKTLIIKFMEE